MRPEPASYPSPLLTFGGAVTDAGAASASDVLYRLSSASRTPSATSTPPVSRSARASHGP
jgi:hypothetical protein